MHLFLIPLATFTPYPAVGVICSAQMNSLKLGEIIECHYQSECWSRIHLPTYLPPLGTEVQV